MDPGLLAAVTGADRLTRRQALARVAQLVGGSLSVSMLGGLAACHRVPGAEASALTGGQREVLASVVDHIVPATDTPGARAVGVHDFIEAVWSECFTDADRAAFAEGLAAVDERARRAYGRPFGECAHGEQLALLTEIDGEAFGAAPPPPARPRAGEAPPPDARPEPAEWVWGEPHRPRPAAVPFWRTVKRLTLVGYYTSQVGATEELRYAPVPGRFDGCVPLAQVGRAWAV